jgi:hypothetical protein
MRRHIRRPTPTGVPFFRPTVHPRRPRATPGRAFALSTWLRPCVRSDSATRDNYPTRFPLQSPPQHPPPPTPPNPCCSLCNAGGVCDELCVMLQGIDSDVPRTSLLSPHLSNAFPSHAQSPFSEMDEIAPMRHDVEYIMSHWTANDSPPINVPFEFLLEDSKEAPAGGVHQRVRLTYGLGRHRRIRRIHDGGLLHSSPDTIHTHTIQWSGHVR